MGQSTALPLAYQVRHRAQAEREAGLKLPSSNLVNRRFSPVANNPGGAGLHFLNRIAASVTPSSLALRIASRLNSGL